MKLIRKYLVETNGANAIEYSMIAAGVALTIAATVYLLGGKVLSLFAGLPAIFGL